ncbi:MAG: DUF4189 domain-containing protein [Pseudonocardia sp.]|nr:DUF4189 domain-containing protein [Pseudonocardia sp.]
MAHLSIIRIAVPSLLAAAAFIFSSGVANAQPDTWAAIAISMQTGNYGYTYDYPTLADAQYGAISQCSAADCQAVVWVTNGCAAVARAPNAWGWGYASSLTSAEYEAVSHTPGPGAQVLAWVCTSGHE